MEVLIIYLIVIVGGIVWILLDEYRRQKCGPSLSEQFDVTMAELDREVRRGIEADTERLRQECERMEAQKQYRDELRKKCPELYQ